MYIMFRDLKVNKSYFKIPTLCSKVLTISGNCEGWLYVILLEDMLSVRKKPSNQCSMELPVHFSGHFKKQRFPVKISFNFL